MNVTMHQLLDTAELLIENNGDAATTGSANGGSALPVTAASRCRGAAFALRAALESAVAICLAAHGAPHAICEGTMRASLIWLRICAEAGTARRARAVWSQLCLGCHYHQYEIGPTEDQVRAWRTEVAAIVALLAP
ncbi:hypothetical protein RM780_10260 [Streptomyces sp. DSM 44917]|uniref:Uncharacterized protein n=1 Tax=Streptomyces boetiae TaxID=3075541 RepID=A0ABU2L6Z5_9ACTN|nr:hypothetical protein [Streptomyces sp. DSM 44917]MDT0307345.1 hypothetical protein [Streptomyces sp. DSM 44917]